MARRRGTRVRTTPTTGCSWHAPTGTCRNTRASATSCLPMDQPGVEVRPIRQMNGHSSFNEVFMTDARIPAANLVGDVGDGWRVARTTLMHERTFATLRRPSFSSSAGRALEEAAAEAADHFATYVWYPAARRSRRPDPERATVLGRDATIRRCAIRSRRSRRSSASASGRHGEGRLRGPSVGLPARKAHSASSRRANSRGVRRARTRASPARQACSPTTPARPATGSAR